MRRRPWMIFVYIFWACSGHVSFKTKVAARIIADPARLPWREDVIAFVRQQHAAGRTTALVTASHLRMAKAAADHLGCFDHAIGTDNTENFRAEAKVRAIREQLNTEAFDYIGDSRMDLPVWAAATEAYLVSPEKTIEKQARQTSNVVRVFDWPQGSEAEIQHQPRPSFFIGVLLGLPLFLLKWLDLWAADYLVVFVAWCGLWSLYASLVIARDLLRLDEDRADPKRRGRLIAAGRWRIESAIKSSVKIFAISAICAVFVIFNEWSRLF